LSSLRSGFKTQRTQRHEENKALSHSSPLGFIDPYAYAALRAFFAPLREIMHLQKAAITGQNRPHRPT
jgi:hypothetical protein